MPPDSVARDVERSAARSGTASVVCWPPTSVSLNMNTTEVGRLGLTGREEDDLVEFLKTLTDGYK